ncbi:hypothetical protein MKZ38_010778 [Zalerion maritima]|uniref:DUF1740-domain-containing protein n=1 Tax=Zalerion maritima TaxID=339359 RepID=A0AAD5RY64_9PEZI|nr:hypothetical protein MKZ38_010778 [Zalerion maritima]
MHPAIGNTFPSQSPPPLRLQLTAMGVTKHDKPPKDDALLAKHPDTDGKDLNLSSRVLSNANSKVSVRSAPPDTGTFMNKLSNTLPDGTVLFVQDLKGDPLVSRYGDIDRSKVPPYRRAGRGQILGSNGHLAVYQDGSREAFSIRLDQVRDSARRGRDRPLSNIAYLKSKPVRVRPASDSELVFDPSQDFISLNPARKRKRTGHEYENLPSGDEGPNYRSIEGKAKEHEFSDSDLNYTSSSSSASQHFVDDEPAVQRNKELKRHLDQHPEDSDAWLERVALQDDVLRAAKGDVSDLTDAEKRSQAEIRLDMLQKALKHASLDNKPRLQVALMSEGVKVWDKKKLDKKWKDVQNKDDNLSLFWLYLETQLTNSEEFAYDNLKGIFVSRIQTLKDQVTRLRENTESNALQYYEQLLWVFLRATRFILDSGYTEVAVAAWQALLEMHFCRPAGLDDVDTLAAGNRFNKFWDSEILRVGETGAEGWNQSSRLRLPQNVQVDRAKEEPAFPSKTDPYQSWAFEECQHAKNSKLPIRLTDLRENQDYDPFRLVLYEDIQRLLFSIPKPYVATMRPQILDTFLVFCGLPPAFANSENILAILKDPFAMAGLSDMERMLLGEGVLDAEPEEMSRKKPTFIQSGAQYVPSLQVLFYGPNWFQYLPPWQESAKSTDWAVDRQWVLSVLRQLVTLHQVEGLAEYYFALECAKDPSKTKSVAKTLLRKYPSNMGLYGAYGLAESARGKPEVGMAVVSSATNLKADGKMVLFYIWAWMELEQGNKSAATLRLCQGVYAADGLAQPDAPSPSAVLKTKQVLSSRKDYLLSSGSHSAAAETASALVLTVYLASTLVDGDSLPTQGDLSPVLKEIAGFNKAFHERFPNANVAQSQSHQLFFQECCRLLYYNASHFPHRPADLRDAIVSFAELYPTNTLLLSMLSWADSAAAASNPLRASSVKNLLEKQSFRPQHDCPAVRVFAIWHAATTSPSPHAARAAFEAAFKSDVCAAGTSPLWRTYVRFVALHSAFQPRKSKKKKGKKSKARDEEMELRNEMARKTFYRAVNACPGVKSLVIEGFCALEPQMPRDELDELGSQMVRWGLRIRADLGDFVAGLGKSL